MVQYCSDFAFVHGIRGPFAGLLCADGIVLVGLLQSIACPFHHLLLYTAVLWRLLSPPVSPHIPVL